MNASVSLLGKLAQAGCGTESGAGIHLGWTQLDAFHVRSNQDLDFKAGFTDNQPQPGFESGYKLLPWRSSWASSLS